MAMHNPRTTTFSALPLDELVEAARDAAAMSHGGHVAATMEQMSNPGTMTDPQQARFDADPPGTVRPAVFPRLERAVLEREAAIQAAAVDAALSVPAPLDPAEEAARILGEARATARSMLAQAREAIAVEREQAVQLGHAEGHAQGMTEADEEMAGLVRTCEQIGIQVMEERARLAEESESDVVELAIAIARRIVNAAIDVDETLVIEACRGAMRKAFQRDSLQVLAHPGDLDLLRTAGPELARELGGVEHLDFVEERRLDRGSVIVRTPAGEIDGTIRGKADKIEQALREGIEQGRAERRAA